MPDEQKNQKMKIGKDLSIVDIDRIIEMAWEDRTSFEAIEIQFELKQQDVIKLMRTQLKTGNFKLWRQRTKGRNTKHEMMRGDDVNRFKCNRQITKSINDKSFVCG